MKSGLDCCFFAIQRVSEGLNYLQAFLSVRKWLFLVDALITGPSLSLSLSTPPPVFPPILHLLLLTATLKTQAAVLCCPPTTLACELPAWCERLLTALRCSDGRSWGCFLSVTAWPVNTSNRWNSLITSWGFGFYFPARLPKQKSLCGNLLMTYGGFFLPSKVLVWHNKGPNSDEMIHSQ